MTPLRPRVRLALKRAHPGLDDKTIDEYQSLLVRRFQLDPKRHKKLIADLDEKRERIIAERMPHYRWVIQATRRGQDSRDARVRIGPPDTLKPSELPAREDAPRDRPQVGPRAKRRPGRERRPSA